MSVPRAEVEEARRGLGEMAAVAERVEEGEHALFGAAVAEPDRSFVGRVGGEVGEFGGVGGVPVGLCAEGGGVEVRGDGHCGRMR